MATRPPTSSVDDGSDDDNRSSTIIQTDTNQLVVTTISTLTHHQPSIITHNFSSLIKSSQRDHVTWFHRLNGRGKPRGLVRPNSRGQLTYRMANRVD